jgi:hypothetical protein
MTKWLVVNDIHLQAFFREQSPIGAGDTTPYLWKQSVAAMRAFVPGARVVVLGGDELAHDWRSLAREHGASPETSAIAATREIASDLDAAFPHAQFLVALGNNDDPCGDYRSDTSGAYLDTLERIWEPLVDRAGAAPAFRTQFLRGGYYSSRLPNGEEAIVLNSVFWSPFYQGGCESKPVDAGAAELGWLNDTLATLPASGRAMLLMHVPPGYDPQSTMMTRDFYAVPFLTAAANGGLLDAVARHEPKIAFAIGAHTHRYDFRIVSDVPMLIASSISPVYRNSPAFYELDIDADGSLHDVVPYVYTFNRDRYERKLSFDEAFNVPAFDTASLRAIAQRIRTDAATRAAWQQGHDVWGAPSRGPWLPNACAQTELSDGFAPCAGVRTRELLAAAVLIAIVAGLLAVVVTLRRRRVDRRT